MNFIFDLNSRILQNFQNAHWISWVGYGYGAEVRVGVRAGILVLLANFLLFCRMLSNQVFIANFTQNVPVKKFWKSVNIWRRYGQKFVTYFLGHPVRFVGNFKWTRWRSRAWDWVRGKQHGWLSQPAR